MKGDVTIMPIAAGKRGLACTWCGRLRCLFGSSTRTACPSLVAPPAGHTLGGACWHITVGGESIVYAPRLNPRSELLLGKSPLASLVARPTALITDARPYDDALAAASTAAVAAAAAACTAAGVPVGTPSALVTQQLLTEIGDTLRGGGSVLLPAPTAGRALELLLVLESSWSRDYHTPIFYVAHTAATVIAYAKTMLEYSHERLTRSFTEERVTPFTFEHVRPVCSGQELSEILRWQRSPVVIVSSLASLEAGIGRDTLLTTILPDKRHAVIVTGELRLGARSSLVNATRPSPSPSRPPTPACLLACLAWRMQIARAFPPAVSQLLC